uniref:Uncharacterized protein n=1 Tax=Sphaerodactylus townsendi TaxID=933632 RepID=A0ACB8ELC0_9SAUR
MKLISTLSQATWEVRGGHHLSHTNAVSSPHPSPILMWQEGTKVLGRQECCGMGKYFPPELEKPAPTINSSIYPRPQDSLPPLHIVLEPIHSIKKMLRLQTT